MGIGGVPGLSTIHQGMRSTATLASVFHLSSAHTHIHPFLYRLPHPTPQSTISYASHCPLLPAALPSHWCTTALRGRHLQPLRYTLSSPIIPPVLEHPYPPTLRESVHPLPLGSGLGHSFLSPPRTPGARTRRPETCRTPYQYLRWRGVLRRGYLL